jgi:catechol 2,3-dioxygenase-like lactoylglutathione lyase family enzyme
MKTLGVHHVSINVDDLDASIDFYVGQLGLSVRSDRPELAVGGAWLDAGGEQVHLIVGRPADAVGQHFALRVDDIDQAVTALRAAGTKVSDPVRIGTDIQCFMSDPCGNSIELHQVGAKKRRRTAALAST